MRFETLDIVDLSESDVPYRFVQTSAGRIHYQMEGDGDLIVLVHGFSVPSFYWDSNFDPIKNAGYRVLRYDLFGRGYSDRPQQDYDLNLFVTQLELLLQQLVVTGKLTLVGLSMGGAIVTAFAARHPEMISKLVLVAPAGLSEDFDEMIDNFRTMDLNDTLNDGMIAGMADDFRGLSADLDHLRLQYTEQMKYRGFREAIQSTVLHFPFAGMEDIFATVGQHSIPTLLFWGTEDKVLPYHDHEKALLAIPNVEFVKIEGGGHALQMEHADLVNRKILDFVKNIS
ncbi:MAG: alpha/beta fold hydrolase [Candidatus Kariarchaeaceae archaeon]|jgi:pimeloyl-ACP methyl ester carboxylesterase